MIDIGLARTLLAIARVTAEHGKRIESHLADELRAIVNTHTLPPGVVREARRILEWDLGA